MFSLATTLYGVGESYNKDISPKQLPVSYTLNVCCDDDLTLTLLLDEADYTMASRISQTISTNITPARALDGGAVEVNIPQRYLNDRVTFLSIIENQIVGAVSEVLKE